MSERLHPGAPSTVLGRIGEIALAASLFGIPTVRHRRIERATHFEVAELNSLGAKDLPRVYYAVVGAEGRQPILEEHAVDNSDEALNKLPSHERKLVKEFLLGRQLFMDPQDRWIHVRYGGLGSAEEAMRLI